MMDAIINRIMAFKLKISCCSLSFLFDCCFPFSSSSPRPHLFRAGGVEGWEGVDLPLLLLHLLSLLSLLRWKCRSIRWGKSVIGNERSLEAHLPQLSLSDARKKHNRKQAENRKRPEAPATRFSPNKIKERERETERQKETK